MTRYYAMLQRNLLYTGIARGKRLVVIVGQKKAVAIAVRSTSGGRRWSKLHEWLGNPGSVCKKPIPLRSTRPRLKSRRSGAVQQRRGDDYEASRGGGIEPGARWRSPGGGLCEASSRSRMRACRALTAAAGVLEMIPRLTPWRWPERQPYPY
jgi:hypothetical protein